MGCEFWHKRINTGCSDFISDTPLVDYALYVAGENGSSKLGLGDTVKRITPTYLGSYSTMKTDTNHSILLKANGDVYGCGAGSSGQFGDGLNSSQITPAIINTGVKQALAGRYYSIVLKTDNTVWCAGGNSLGELGQGDEVKHDTWVQIPGEWKFIGVSNQTTFLIDINDDLYGCGDGSYGLLNNSSANSSTPVLIASGITSLLTGFYHLFYEQSGSWYALGSNWEGALGFGDTTNRHAATVVPYSNIPFACGGEHTLYVNNDVLTASGYNFDGELADGSQDDRWSPVTSLGGHLARSAHAGWYFSLIQDTDGVTWGAGANNDGQLGLNVVTNLFTTLQRIGGSWVKVEASTDVTAFFGLQAPYIPPTPLFPINEALGFGVGVDHFVEFTIIDPTGYDILDNYSEYLFEINGLMSVAPVDGTTIVWSQSGPGTGDDWFDFRLNKSGASWTDIIMGNATDIPGGKNVVVKLYKNAVLVDHMEYDSFINGFMTATCYLGGMFFGKDGTTVANITFIDNR